MIRMTVDRAIQIIEDDSDYDDDGILKDKLRRNTRTNIPMWNTCRENENYDEDY